MLSVMPPKKKKSAANHTLKHPNMVLVRLTDEEVTALHSYIASQEVRPERPAVLLVSLRKFLAERGHLKARD